MFTGIGAFVAVISSPVHRRFVQILLSWSFWLCRFACCFCLRMTRSPLLSTNATALLVKCDVAIFGVSYGSWFYQLRCEHFADFLGGRRQIDAEIVHEVFDVAYTSGFARHIFTAPGDDDELFSSNF